MAETSIEWTDFTVNFWWGCTKVGPGCDHCYAETWDKRTGGAHWGPHAERRRIKGAAASLRKINDKAPEYHFVHGRYPRVFMHSMSDLFDNAVPSEWRRDALVAAEMAENTRIQLVTKRISNVEAMTFPIWLLWPQHIGLMITICNQAEADRDIPKLLALKVELGIPWVGLSIEPMLGPIDLSRWHGVHHHPANRTDDPETMAQINVVIAAARASFRAEHGNTGVDWVICGGESGPHARPMHPDWARSLRDQCIAAGVPFFFKQWGEWAPADDFPSETQESFDVRGLTCDGSIRIGKKAAGRLLDGRTWDEVPA
jgi:protein gp37